MRSPKYVTRVAWTPDERGLITALRRLLGRSERQIIAEALRALYRSSTLLDWRPGGPSSHQAARKERAEKVRARRGTSVLEADVLEELDAAPDVATLGDRRAG